MKKVLSIIFLAAVLAGCATPQPTVTPTLTVAATEEPTYTPVPTEKATTTPEPTATVAITPTYPVTGEGPDSYTAGVDPLTGLTVANVDLLNRRPIVVKVQNIPRTGRPQYGLTKADLVYEYYTEFGSTRFSAVFYGQDAERVSPVRSARWFDFNVVRAYKAVFAFGSAYADLYSAILNSDFGDRLVLENSTSCPAFCRVDVNTTNDLAVNTAAMKEYLKSLNIDNTAQDLSGMFFQKQAPEGGEALPSFYVRYSGSIYNRWDYDAASGRYLRFVDNKDALGTDPEEYVQLTDALTNQPVAADTVVMLLVNHEWIKYGNGSEIINMSLLGNGTAYVARDGKMYQVQWTRATHSDVISLINADGTPFPFKPGQTWFEVLGNSSTLEKSESSWRWVWMWP